MTFATHPLLISHGRGLSLSKPAIQSVCTVGWVWSRRGSDGFHCSECVNFHEHAQQNRLREFRDRNFAGSMRNIHITSPFLVWKTAGDSNQYTVASSICVPATDYLSTLTVVGLGLSILFFSPYIARLIQCVRRSLGILHTLSMGLTDDLLGPISDIAGRSLRCCNLIGGSEDAPTFLSQRETPLRQSGKALRLGLWLSGVSHCSTHLRGTGIIGVVISHAWVFTSFFLF